jgi:hypothetical protein
VGPAPGEALPGGPIHGGYLSVRGTAPDRLVWEVGGRPFTAGALSGDERGDEARMNAA